MNSNIPLMLKTHTSSNHFYYYVALSNVTLMYDDYDDCINYMLDADSDRIEVLESVDGNEVKIASLRCKTYEELLVELDLNNLLHGGSVLKRDNLSITEKIKELTNTVNQLKKENALLKKKLKDIEKVFKASEA